MEESPHITAWLFITFVCYFLIIPIIKHTLYLHHFFLKFDRGLYLFLFILIAGFLYFNLIFKARYLKIIEKFTEENKYWKIIGNVFIIVILIFIFYLNIILP
jgi:hypothetical protein